MNITINTDRLSDLVHSLIGEIPDERGRSAHLVCAMNRMAEELEKARARARDAEVSATQHEGEAERAHRAVRSLNEQLGETVSARDRALDELEREREARATIDEALAQTVCDRDRVLTDLDSARAHERKLRERSAALTEELTEAHAALRKAHELNARLEAELVVRASEHAHMRAEWRRTVMEETHIRAEYDKLKEKILSTSSI